MSAVELRNAIADRLPELIGEYTLANQEKTPAIYCAYQGDASTNDRTCEGLEILVINSTSHKYSVYLKHWGTAASNLESVTRKLQRYFVVSSIEEIKIKEQPRLRTVVKLTIDAEQLFEYDSDFLS